MKSLQEQLMGAGLVDAKKAKSLKQEKRKQNKQQSKLKKGEVRIDENAERLEAERKAKAERDRDLNRQRQQLADEKAIVAQIKQLIETNAIKPEKDDVGFQFADGSKIQKIYVSEVLQNQLAKGQVSIAKLEDRYILIPNSVADKIKQRNEAYVVERKLENHQIDEDDPYKDYQIPDDLMW